MGLLAKTLQTVETSHFHMHHKTHSYRPIKVQKQQVKMDVSGWEPLSEKNADLVTDFM